MLPRYQSPNYRLIHGDCHDTLNDLKGLEARLVLTDPPYGKVLKDDWDQSGHITDQWCKQIKAACTPDASIYVWCGMGEKSRSLVEFIQVLDKHFTFKDLITWQKRRGIGMRRGWLYTREELLWYVVNPKDFVWNKEAQYSDEPNAFKKGMSGTQVNEKKRITNVWTDVPEQLKKPLGTHPADKPIQALKRVIAAHTDPGDLILDPFCGGGSTLIAAMQMGRMGFGIEKDDHWAEYTKTRLEAEWEKSND